jgi:hypothetical protein
MASPLRVVRAEGVYLHTADGRISADELHRAYDVILEAIQTLV